MMTTELIIKALQNAYHTQQPADGLIFHSDLGNQYTSEAFKKMIDEFGMTQSFIYKGSRYDNDCIESFYANLKKNEVNHVQYIDEKSARIALFQYIESCTTVKEFTVVLVIKHRNKWRTTMLTQVDSLQIYLLHGFIWRGGHDSLLWRASNVFKLAGFPGIKIMPAEAPCQAMIISYKISFKERLKT